MLLVIIKILIEIGLQSQIHNKSVPKIDICEYLRSVSVFFFVHLNNRLLIVMEEVDIKLMRRIIKKDEVIQTLCNDM